MIESSPTPSNMQWCERNVTTTTQCFAGICTREPLNTASNLGYVVVAGIGIVRLMRTNPFKYDIMSWLNTWMCEVSMLLTGIGSFAFHARATRTTQLMDELPLICMVASYTRMSGYWLTRALYRSHNQPNTELYLYRYRALFIGYTAVVLMWTQLYLMTDRYIVFESLVTVQGAALVLMLCRVGHELPRSRVPVGRALGYFFMGKIAWKYERWLYASGSCPITGIGVGLHVYWHIITAAMHWYLMRWNALEMRFGYFYTQLKCIKSQY